MAGSDDDSAHETKPVCNANTGLDIFLMHDELLISLT